MNNRAKLGTEEEAQEVFAISLWEAGFLLASKETEQCKMEEVVVFY